MRLKHSRHKLTRMVANIFPMHTRIRHAPRPAYPALPYARTQRMAFFVSAGNNYSGGRLALTAHAIACARAGAEVWFVTDNALAWRDDYAIPDNMHIIGLADQVPCDLDLLVTDCRGRVAHLCLAVKNKFSHVPLVVVAFETPNWATALAPILGAQMLKEDFRTIEARADLLVAISREGERYLKEFYADGKPTAVIYPAINTEAIDAAPPMEREKPYVVFCGRAVRHKHLEVAVQAVMEYPTPLDLVVIGGIGAYQPAGTLAHEIMRLSQISDRDKFSYMKGAAAVLAPSTFEGFGLVPGEALICGTPVVAYDLPVLREIYGSRIHYARHNDPDDFVAVTHRVLRQSKPVLTEASNHVRSHYGFGTLPARLQAAPYHAITRKSLSVAMICYATPAPMVEACLASVYDVADEINIAYGPVPFWKDYPEGGTLDAIRAFPDPDHKLRIKAQDIWADKRAMWEWCGRMQTGNYQLVTGADMVWVGLDKWLAHPGTTWATPRWVNFWHDLSHWICSPDSAPGRWGDRLEPFGSVCRHRLFGYWRHSFIWKNHPEPVDALGRPVWSAQGNTEAAMQVPECVCYHLGHILDAALMAQKHAYYAARDGHVAHGEYWQQWDGRLGPCGDGKVELVDWQLPEQVIAAGKAIIL